MHEGKIQRPPSQAKHRHPDQFLLQEKAQQWNATIEHALHDRNVCNALVVADQQVTAIPAQTGQLIHINMQTRQQADQCAVDRDPTLRNCSQNRGNELSETWNRHDQLDQSQQQQRRGVNQRVERNQRAIERDAQGDKHQIDSTGCWRWMETNSSSNAASQSNACWSMQLIIGPIAPELRANAHWKRSRLPRWIDSERV